MELRKVPRLLGHPHLNLLPQRPQLIFKFLSHSHASLRLPLQLRAYSLQIRLQFATLLLESEDTFLLLIELSF